MTNDELVERAARAIEDQLTEEDGWMVGTPALAEMCRDFAQAALRALADQREAEIGLLRDPRPSDVLFADACALVKTGDYRMAWFKLCQAMPKRYEEGYADGRAALGGKTDA